MREQSQRKATSLGISKPDNFFTHSGGHFVESGLYRAAFDWEQDRSCKRRKGQIGGGEAAASQELAPVTEAFINVLENAANTLDRALCAFGCDLVRLANQKAGDGRNHWNHARLDPRNAA